MHCPESPVEPTDANTRMRTSGCVSMYVDWGIVAGFECLRLCQLWQQPAGERPRPTRCFSRSGQKEGSETSQKPYPRKRRGRGRKVHFPICIDYNDCNQRDKRSKQGKRGKWQKPIIFVPCSASGASGASGRNQLAAPRGTHTAILSIFINIQLNTEFSRNYCSFLGSWKG